jgi:hypothetical protein
MFFVLARGLPQLLMYPSRPTHTCQNPACVRAFGASGRSSKSWIDYRCVCARGAGSEGRIRVAADWVCVHHFTLLPLCALAHPPPPHTHTHTLSPSSLFGHQIVCHLTTPDYKAAEYYNPCVAGGHCLHAPLPLSAWAAFPTPSSVLLLCIWFSCLLSSHVPLSLNSCGLTGRTRSALPCDACSFVFSPCFCVVAHPLGPSLVARTPFPQRCVVGSVPVLVGYCFAHCSSQCGLHRLLCAGACVYVCVPVCHRPRFPWIAVTHHNTAPQSVRVCREVALLWPCSRVRITTPTPTPTPSLESAGASAL